MLAAASRAAETETTTVAPNEKELSYLSWFASALTCPKSGCIFYFGTLLRPFLASLKVCLSPVLRRLFSINLLSFSKVRVLLLHFSADFLG